MPIKTLGRFGLRASKIPQIILLSLHIHAGSLLNAMASILSFNDFNFAKLLCQKEEKSRKKLHEAKFLRQLIFTLIVTIMFAG